MDLEQELASKIISIDEVRDVLKGEIVCGDCYECGVRQFAEKHGVSLSRIDCEEFAKSVVDVVCDIRKKLVVRKPIDDEKPVVKRYGPCKKCANRQERDGDYWLFCSHFHNFTSPDGFCNNFKPEQKGGDEKCTKVE